MAKVNFLIEWKASFSPSNAPVLLSRTLDNIDSGIFRNTTFVHKLWKTVARKIGSTVDLRFKSQGPGWKGLTPRYFEWKKRTVSKGKRIQVGTLGKRKAKFTEIGQLTGALRRSATKPNKDANIFEVQNTPGWTGGAFSYAIDLRKLPYAKHFDDSRRFFFLDNAEAQAVMKKAHTKIRARFNELAKKKV